MNTKSVIGYVAVLIVGFIIGFAVESFFRFDIFSKDKVYFDEKLIESRLAQDRAFAEYEEELEAQSENIEERLENLRKDTENIETDLKEYNLDNIICYEVNPESSQSCAIVCK